MARHYLFEVLFGFVLFEFCSAYDGSDKNKFRLKKSQLPGVPNRFELKGGPNVVTELEKYIDEISQLAFAKNATANYKVKVEFIPNTPDFMKQNEINRPVHRKKSAFTKKSKKFQVPLKKKPIHLSPFDIIMKRLAEEEAMVPVNQPTQFAETTKMEEFYEIRTTRAPPVGKYKPILNRHRMKSGYRAQPVRSKIIVLHK